MMHLFRGTLFPEKKEKTFDLLNQNKDSKVSHGRGNSIRNKVRVWVELDSPDPLKHLRIGLREY